MSSDSPDLVDVEVRRVQNGEEAAELCLDIVAGHPKLLSGLADFGALKLDLDATARLLDGLDPITGEELLDPGRYAATEISLSPSAAIQASFSKHPEDRDRLRRAHIHAVNQLIRTDSFRPGYIATKDGSQQPRHMIMLAYKPDEAKIGTNLVIFQPALTKSGEIGRFIPNGFSPVLVKELYDNILVQRLGIGRDELVSRVSHRRISQLSDEELGIGSFSIY